LLNQIWPGIDDILLNFFATFSSVLRMLVTVLISVFQIRCDCLLCMVKCWALSITNETSLLYCVSCHQSSRISLTFIDPIHFRGSELCCRNNAASPRAT